MSTYRQGAIMKSIGRVAGRFEGSGTWHDAAGKSQTYRVVQTNEGDSEGFRILFKHEFEDGTSTEADFRMKWITPCLFDLLTAGKAAGKGYVLGDCCHYYLQAGPAYVEASYHVTSTGLRVFGSSTTNAEGNFIAWEEELERTE
jgi:hypothetical protein